jgi:hypothetical protein
MKKLKIFSGSGNQKAKSLQRCGQRFQAVIPGFKKHSVPFTQTVPPGLTIDQRFPVALASTPAQLYPAAVPACFRQSKGFLPERCGDVGLLKPEKGLFIDVPHPPLIQHIKIAWINASVCLDNIIFSAAS